MTAIRIIDDHTELANIGANTHAQIDTMLAAAIPYVGATSDVDLGGHNLATTGVLSSRGLKILGNYTLAWRNPADTVTNAYLHYDGNLQMRNVSGNITLQADLIDLGTTPLTTTGTITGVISHADLTNLGADDHTQYVLADSTRDIVKDQNGITNLVVDNGTNGTAAKAAFRVQTDSGSASFSALSAGHLTSNQYKTDSALLESDASLSAGLHLSAVSGEIGFWQGNTRRGSIWTDGKWKIGSGVPSEVLDVAGNIAVSGTVDGVDVAALSTTVGGLTDNSIANALHRHSELVASDGSPDPALSVDAAGKIGIGTTSPNQLLSLSSGYSTIPGLGNEGGSFSIKTANVLGLIAGSISGGNFFIQVQRTSGAATAYDLLLQPSGGSIGIGTVAPATSALLDLTSTTGALLLTRMTTAQKNALTAVNGMVLYDSTLNKFQGYENGAWTSLI